MSLIYRGTSSDDVHFNVTERRVYNAPAFDVTGIEVPGRSGDILNSQERFKNKSIVYTGFIRSSDFPGDTTWERLSRGLRTIKAWVCGDAGKYHDLTDDYDPGFVRRAFVSGETAISEVLDRPDGATITITFMAEPFMYEESDPIELPETGTASGAIASFEGVAAPLQSLKFNVEPQQDLHGYDYPWPGGGGKNKLNYDAWKSLPITNGTAVFENNGITLTATADGCYTAYSPVAGFPADAKIPVTEGQTIVLSWTTPDTSAVGRVYIFPNGAAAGSVNVLNNDDTKLKYTVAAGVTFVTFRFGVSYSGTTIHFNNIQVEVGTTATAYAPYSNISPISGWSQVDGKQTAENFIANATIVSGGLNANNGLNIVNATRIRTENYNPVSAGTYKIGNDENYEWVCYVYSADSSHTFINGESQKSWQSVSNTMTIAGDRTVRISWRKSSSNPNIDPSEIHRPWMAKTNTLTPITIALGQTVYGGTVDALAGEGESQLGSKTYSGAASENWSYSSGRFSTPLSDAEDSTSRLEVLCNIGKYSSTGSAVGTIFLYGKILYYYAPSNITTVADFKTWLASNNMQVVYPLASPTTLSLTPVSGLTSLLGQNNIWANTGDTEVEYVEPTENPTEWPSKPRLEITMAGAGTLTVNGKTWSIGAYTGTLICDSEIMDWYDASNLKNSLVSGDGFPELQPGENVITYTGGITKVVAKPRWRTL